MSRSAPVIQTMAAENRLVRSFIFVKKIYSSFKNSMHESMLKRMKIHLELADYESDL